MALIFISHSPLNPPRYTSGRRESGHVELARLPLLNGDAAAAEGDPHQARSLAEAHEAARTIRERAAGVAAGGTG